MLKEKGYIIYIISSNTKKNIQKVLTLCDMDCVDEVIHTIRILNKTNTIKKYLKKHKNIQQAFVVSDEYKDIISANKLKLCSIAINWGANHFAENDVTKPDYIVNSTEELESIILHHT